MNKLLTLMFSIILVVGFTTPCHAKTFEKCMKKWEKSVYSCKKKDYKKQEPCYKKAAKTVYKCVKKTKKIKDTKGLSRCLEKDAMERFWGWTSRDLDEGVDRFRRRAYDYCFKFYQDRS